MQENESYGDALIYQLSEDLQREFPDSKGFSYRNLHYMKNMYIVFNQVDINLPQVVADSLDENRKFYARHKASESKKSKKEKTPCILSPKAQRPSVPCVFRQGSRPSVPRETNRFGRKKIREICVICGRKKLGSRE